MRSVFPDWPIRSDGACVHLTVDNKCGIYATRPAVCRIDDSRPAGVSLADWHAQNADGCETLQRLLGLDPRTWRPPIGSLRGPT